MDFEGWYWHQYFKSFISISTGFISIKFGADVHGATKINLNDFDDLSDFLSCAINSTKFMSWDLFKETTEFPSPWFNSHHDKGHLTKTFNPLIPRRATVAIYSNCMSFWINTSAEWEIIYYKFAQLPLGLYKTYCQNDNRKKGTFTVLKILGWIQ